MATTSFISVKEEPQSLPPLPQPQLPPQSQVKDEPQEEHAIIVPCQERQQQQEPPQFLKSIAELNNLSSSINDFYRKFNELRDHLNFIQTAIEQREQQLQQKIQSDTPPTTTSSSVAITEIKSATIAAAAAAELESNTKKEAPLKKSSSSSELISLCETMCGRGLRKYITSNLSNISKLRSEVPLALTCSPKPAKLVLDCFGGFYLQGSRAYKKGSHMIPGRKASILALEFFMLILNDDSIAIEFDSNVKQEAEHAAIAWRKRLIAEGGVCKATEIDAQGLLLFVGCYGIPKVFTNGDIWDLIKLSNSKQISDALKRSRILVTRVSDILERMMNNGMKVEAVDVACTFGIEDKYPPQKLLTSFLRDSKETLNRRKREGNNSPVLLKEASQKHLAKLKTAMKFLEDHKLDPKKMLPEWQFREMIDKLEKDIAELNRKIDDKVPQKRKADDNEFLNNLKSQEAKHLRFTGSALISSPSFRLHEQRVPGDADANSLYNASMRINMLDGGFPGHINNPPIAGSMLYRSGSYSAAYGAPSSSSVTGVYRETLADRTGKTMESNASGYGWHGVADIPIINGSRVHSFVHEPASGLFGPSPSIESFVGLINSSPAGAANPSSNSDLYRFADAVK